MNRFVVIIALTINVIFCHASATDVTTPSGNEDEAPLNSKSPVNVISQWSFLSCQVSGQEREAKISPAQVALYPGEKNTEAATAFMVNYIEFLQTYLMDSRELASAIVKCQKQDRPSESCAPINQYVDQYLAKVIRVARFNLALANIGHDSVNAKLVSPKGVPKAVPWEPLSLKQKCVPKENPEKNCSSERDLADGQMINYLKQVDQRIQTDEDCVKNLCVHPEVLRRQERTIVQEQHKKIYLNILSQFPVLQYISSLNPTRSEISKAVNATIRNNKVEYDKLEKLKKQVKNRRSSDVFNHSTLSMLDYTPFIDTFLWKHPDQCNVVEDLFDIKSRRSRVGNIGLTSFFVGTALIAPARIGVGAMTTVAGGMATQSYTSLQASKARNFSVVSSALELSDPDDIRKDGYLGYSINDVMAAQTDFKINSAMVPLIFVSGGLTKSIITKALKFK